MDSFEFTKIAGAVIAALLLIFGTKVIVEVNAQKPLTSAGYALPAAEPAPEKTAEAGAKAGAAQGAKAGSAAAPNGDAKGQPATKAGGDVVALLAKANPESGKGGFSKCKACHVVQKGQKATVGPNLWGIVNRPKASAEFAYSDALKSKGGDWSFADLSAFIRNPKAYVPGTKMNFAGISDPTVEADIIAYLATLADAPVPLPK